MLLREQSGSSSMWGRILLCRSVASLRFHVPHGISYRNGFDFLPTRKRDKAGAARAVRRSRGFVYRSNQM